MAAATASTLLVTPQQTGAFSIPPLDAAAARTASELLQQNHERFHMYFNDMGFHNHLVHHMLALYAFNAPPEVLKRHYNDNTGYQVAMKPVDQAALKDLADPAKFKQYLFQRDRYHDYLALFEGEIASLGLAATLHKYLFDGSAQSADMLDRLFAGILHPVIHLGYGLEWEQPALVAEALAMTATHDAWLHDLFAAVDAAAKASPPPSPASLNNIVAALSADAEIRTSARLDDDMRARYGVDGRARAHVAPLLARWTVTPDNLAASIAELADLALGLVTTAAVRPGHPPRVDFTLMHCANAVPLVTAIATHPAVPPAAAARLVQCLAWYTLVTYTAQGSPPLDPAPLRAYKPRNPEATWEGIRQRALQVPDDGHIIKLMRAIRFGEKYTAAHPVAAATLPAAADWLLAGNMVLDVAEADRNYRWVHGAGFDESWQRDARP